MKKWAYPKQGGFTIVELLIVVVVIAILAAITIVAYNGIQNRAKASSVQAALNQAVTKVQAYAVDNADTYPTDQAAFNSLGIASGDATYQYSANNTSNPKSFCITATIQNLSYYQDMGGKPTAGACAGHGANGVVPITNLAYNPTAAGGLTGWDVTSGNTLALLSGGGPEGQSSVTATRSSGAGALVVDYGRTGATVYAPVVPGETYTSSMWVRPTLSGSQQLGILVRFYSSGGSQLDSNTGNGYAVLPNNTWTRLSRTDTAPAGAAKVRVVALGQSGVDFAQGDVLRVTKVMVTKGSTLYTYADGSSNGWAWGPGGANNDTSSGSPL